MSDGKVTISGTVREHLPTIVARHVCGEALDEIAKTLPGSMTGLGIRRAIMADPEMTTTFNAVIEHRAHFFIDETARLAAECALVGDVAGMKAAMDTYLKLAAKTAPKIYGDKFTVEMVGLGGGAIKHTVEMSPADAYAAMLGNKEKT